MPCERTEAMTGLSTCCAKSGAAGVSMPDMVPGCCLGTGPGDASPGSYKGCIVDLARRSMGTSFFVGISDGGLVEAQMIARCRLIDCA